MIVVGGGKPRAGLLQGSAQGRLETERRRRRVAAQEAAQSRGTGRSAGSSASSSSQALRVDTPVVCVYCICSARRQPRIHGIAGGRAGRQAGGPLRAALLQ